MSIPINSDVVPPSVASAPIAKHHGMKEALDLIYKKYEERLSTLPKANGWLPGANVYLYQGFWHESMGVISIGTVMAAQETFVAQPTDLYIVTPPKCGTTWLKALSFATVNRAKYNSSSFSTHPLQTLNPHKCVPSLEFEASSTNPTYPDGHSPRLFSTHIPYTSLPESVRNSGCRVVYMSRNPKDVLVSLFHFINKIRNNLGHPPMTFEEAFELFTKGCSQNGPYWDHVKEYYKASVENPKKIMFLTYEDMQMDPVNNLKRLAEFWGYPFTKEEEAEGVVNDIVKLCSFDTLKEVNKNGVLDGVVPNDAFFREGKTGEWSNYLTDEMCQVLDQITKKEFHGLNILY